jgi:uncharacterized Zn-finger protein
MIDEFFSCNSCPEIFKTPQALEKHVENTHFLNHPKKTVTKINKSVKKAAARQHKCPKDTCVKIFKKASLLHRHLLVHEEKSKQFKCDFCNPAKYFSQKSSLQLHQLIHAGIRNWSCRKCGISFLQKGNLLR